MTKTIASAAASSTNSTSSTLASSDTADFLIPDYSCASTVRDRPFNGFRVAASDKARGLVRELTRLILSYEAHRAPRRRVRRSVDLGIFEQQVEALVCDLLHRELKHPGAWLAISYSNDRLGKFDRYKPVAITKKLREVIDYMATPEMEIAEVIPGHRNPINPSLSRQTTIRAGHRLRQCIADQGFGFSDFKLCKTQEIIILKDTKEDIWDAGQWLQYEDTPATVAMRSELASINDFLEQADLEYVPWDDYKLPVDTTDRRLRRYFNNHSFVQGGRVFGGFWQPMPKPVRKGIVIDGCDTITLDFSQSLPRILYGFYGVTPNFDDAYAVPGLDGYRDGAKKVFNAMLHVSDPHERKPNGTRKLLPEEYRIGQIVDMILAFHSPVRHAFHMEIGLHLLYQESRILLAVLTRLAEHGIVALPIHDAVIVAECHEDQAKEVMCTVFREIAGTKGFVHRDD